MQKQRLNYTRIHDRCAIIKLKVVETPQKTLILVQPRLLYVYVNKQADDIPPRNGSVFSMEVEVPRLLGTEIAWAVMGPKRNRLKQMYYLFKRQFEKKRT